MRKTNVFVIFFIILIVSSMIAGAHSSSTLNPNMSGWSIQPDLNNNKIISKNQYIMSYTTFGKSSFLLNSWQSTFSSIVSPFTTVAFMVSMNRLDGNMGFRDVKSMFPLYSISLNTEKKDVSYGIRVGNSQNLQSDLFLKAGQPAIIVPQQINGYIEKSFFNGSVTFSLYGSTFISQ